MSSPINRGNPFADAGIVDAGVKDGYLLQHRLSPWMVLLMQRLQPLLGDMGIDLSRGEVAMAE